MNYKGNRGCGCACAVLLVLLAVFASNASDSSLKIGLAVFISVLIIVGLKARRKYSNVESTPNDNADIGEEPHEDDSTDEHPNLKNWFADKAAAQRKRTQDRFLKYLFSMLSKMAKVAGYIKAEEVTAAGKAFDYFKFAQRRRKFCSRVFNEAKDNSRTIYWYAEQFGDLVEEDGKVRAFVYELLWDIACADGRLDPEEEEILRKVCSPLHLSDDSFENQYQAHAACLSDETTDEDEVSEGVESETTDEYKRIYVSGQSPIWDAYDVIESEPTATVEELKAAYRRIAKRFHPDLLQVGGASEAQISEATERMAEINAAWGDICRIREIV